MPYNKNEETMTINSLGRGQSSQIFSSSRPNSVDHIQATLCVRPPHTTRVVEKFCVPVRMDGRPWETHLFLQLPLYGILVVEKYSASLHEVAKDSKKVWMPMADQALNFTLCF